MIHKLGDQEEGPAIQVIHPGAGPPLRVSPEALRTQLAASRVVVVVGQALPEEQLEVSPVGPVGQALKLALFPLRPSVAQTLAKRTTATFTWQVVEVAVSTAPPLRLLRAAWAVEETETQPSIRLPSLVWQIQGVVEAPQEVPIIMPGGK